MGLLSRRGFLGTLAAAIGTAAFNPEKGLWLPQEPQILTATSVEEAALAANLDTLASQFAGMFADRLKVALARDAQATAIRRVIFQHGPAGVLTLEGDPRDGYFETGRRRMITLQVNEQSAPADITDAFHSAAYLLAKDYHGARQATFAPITAQLRPGVPFADAEVGVGADPETGISARVLRFVITNSVYTARPVLGVEICGGTWVPFPPAHTKDGKRARREHALREFYRQGEKPAETSRFAIHDPEDGDWVYDTTGAETVDQLEMRRIKTSSPYRRRVSYTPSGPKLSLGDKIAATERGERIRKGRLV